MSSVIQRKTKLDWLPQAAEKLRMLMAGTKEYTDEDEAPVPLDTFDRVDHFLHSLEAEGISVGIPYMALSPNGTLGLTWKDSSNERYVHLIFRSVEAPTGFLKTRTEQISVTTEASALDALRVFAA